MMTRQFKSVCTGLKRPVDLSKRERSNLPFLSFLFISSCVLQHFFLLGNETREPLLGAINILLIITDVIKWNITKRIDGIQNPSVSSNDLLHAMLLSKSFFLVYGETKRSKKKFFNNIISGFKIYRDILTEGDKSI